MTQLSDSLSIVRGELEFYEQKSEQVWSDAHEAALHATDCEELLALGNFLFERINRLDESWRNAVYTGHWSDDRGFEKVVEGLYRSWSKAGEVLLRWLEQLEGQGFCVEGAEQFRRCCREVRGILTPDDEFFSGDAQVNARDQAIDEHRRGETTELGQLSD
jgi:hypothetical protein